MPRPLSDEYIENTWRSASMLDWVRTDRVRALIKEIRRLRAENKRLKEARDNGTATDRDSGRD